VGVAFGSCPGGRLAKMGNQRRTLYWRRKRSRGERGVWRNRAVTMGVRSIKGRAYIKSGGSLDVSLFRGQEQRRRHNERSRTWKVRCKPGKGQNR
jgi:hypothetical protein